MESPNMASFEARDEFFPGWNPEVPT